MTDCPRCGDKNMSCWMTFGDKITCADCLTPDEEKQLRAARAEGQRRLWAHYEKSSLEATGAFDDA